MWPSQGNKNDLPLLKEVLSKGGLVKPAPFFYKKNLPNCQEVPFSMYFQTLWLSD